MAFPTTLPSYTAADPAKTLDADNHTQRHNSAQDDIVAIATKLGIDSSAVTTSHDYKLSGVTGSDKAASKAGTETLTNKTLSTGSVISSSVDVVEVLKKAHPIGSIYISVVSTNPNTLFGFGTWAALAAGRTLVGLDSGQTEFDAVEKTGGSKTHTLTVDEMPSHTHTQDAHSHGTIRDNDNNKVLGKDGGVDTGGSYGFVNDTVGRGSTWVTGSATATNQNTGGGSAHNNLQPYIVTYMWKRTA